MDVKYRRSFLKDIKKLKGQKAYQIVTEFAFKTLPEIKTLNELNDIKLIKGHSNRYRMRIGDYRIGLEIYENSIEVTRILHRKDFYRYFP